MQPGLAIQLLGTITFTENALNLGNAHLSLPSIGHQNQGRSLFPLIQIYNCPCREELQTSHSRLTKCCPAVDSEYIEEPRTSVKFRLSLNLPGCSSSLSFLGADVDGKTFLDALDEAISPRIKSPSPIDASALSVFLVGMPLKKGTSIFTWLDPTKILVCVSSEGMPSSIDATIESKNVASALFDVFLGSNPVSPSLKDAASNASAAALK